MSHLDLTNLTTVINARGTFTPLGVSRTSPQVCADVTTALANYYLIDELQELASQTLSKYTGAEATSVTHCSAASITISVAATMAGSSPEKVAALPDTTGMRDHVIIPAAHCVNYGQPILQAIRLSGAKPVVVGSQDECSLTDLEKQISDNNTCCLLLVSSRLVTDDPVDISKAVEIAKKHNVPIIIDGAAQDFRIDKLLDTGADLVLASGQKYLASPTAGLVVGNRDLVAATRAQETGIGRGMKATKEAIIGVLSAIGERTSLNVGEWQEMQEAKISNFVERSNAIKGVSARSVPDPTFMPFSRAYLQIDESKARCDAPTLIKALKNGSPAIWVNDDKASQGQLGFELVQITDQEIDMILARLEELLI